MSDPTRSSFYLPAQDATEADVPGVKKKSFSKKMAKSFKKMGTQVKELMTPRGGSQSGEQSPTPAAKSVEGSSNSSNIRTILGRTSSGAKKAAAPSSGPPPSGGGGDEPKQALAASTKAAGSGVLDEPSLEWSSGFSGRYQPPKKTASAAPGTKAGPEKVGKAKTPAQPAVPQRAEPAPAPHPPAPAQLPAAVPRAVEQPERKEKAQKTIPVASPEGKPIPAIAPTNVKVDVRIDPAPEDVPSKPAKALLVQAPPPVAKTVEEQGPAVHSRPVEDARPKQAKGESGFGGALRGLVWLGAAAAVGVLAAKQVPAMRRAPASKRK